MILPTMIKFHCSATAIKDWQMMFIIKLFAVYTQNKHCNWDCWVVNAWHENGPAQVESDM
jgi:hypothetical protein